MYKLTPTGAYGHTYKKQNSNPALISRPTITNYACDCVSFKGQTPIHNNNAGGLHPKSSSEVDRGIEADHSQTLNIDHSVINRNIRCDHTSTLNANHSEINGNIDCDHTSTINANHSTINGNIDCYHTSKVVLTNSRITGKLKVQANRLRLEGSNTIKDLHLIGTSLYEIDHDNLIPLLDEFIQQLFPNTPAIGKIEPEELVECFRRMPETIPYQYNAKDAGKILSAKIANFARQCAFLAQDSKQVEQKDIKKLIETYALRAEAEELLHSDSLQDANMHIKLTPEKEAIVHNFTEKVSKDCLIKPFERLKLPIGTKITGKIILERGAKLPIGWFNPLRLRIYF